MFGLEVRTEQGGVAVLIASKWQEEVAELKRVSEKIMLVRLERGKEYFA